MALVHDPIVRFRDHKLSSWTGLKGRERSQPMKIKLLRASTTAKEVEFAATMPPLDIQRLSVDLMFENFERNETHLWPREDDTRGARHQIQVIADDGSLLRTFDIRDITKESGLKFLGRKVDITG
jgi:hypothetical protein